MLVASDLFDLKHTAAKTYLESFELLWQSIAGIGSMIIEIGKTLDTRQYFSPKENVYIHKSVCLSASACINGPCIIGEKSEIRHGAFIRGSALIGKGCVIGNSTEVKNSILFDCVQVPHYNYVGDSILGYKAHLGAGAITSNVKSDKSSIRIRLPAGSVDTGLKKFGALVGDFAEIGCSSVLNPGTIIMRNSNIYPLTSVRGFIPPNSILKSDGTVVEKL